MSRNATSRYFEAILMLLSLAFIIGDAARLHRGQVRECLDWCIQPRTRRGFWLVKLRPVKVSEAFTEPPSGYSQSGPSRKLPLFVTTCKLVAVRLRIPSLQGDSCPAAVQIQLRRGAVHGALHRSTKAGAQKAR